MHFLLVDNEPIILMIQTKILEKTGAKVEAVDSGFKAIESLQCKQYDAVVLDCQMPEMDGFETAMKIRQMGNQTPIIALTGNDTAEDRVECREAGMDEFLAKPLKISELNTVLGRLNLK
ncbi:MAG: response regulator [Thiotrichales bacterium]|nr:response regulator [Thiotrichales bacterium]